VSSACGERAAGGSAGSTRGAQVRSSLTPGGVVGTLFRAVGGFPVRSTGAATLAGGCPPGVVAGRIICAGPFHTFPIMSKSPYRSRKRPPKCPSTRPRRYS
jgi:hypothetical protein